MAPINISVSPNGLFPCQFRARLLSATRLPSCFLLADPNFFSSATFLHLSLVQYLLSLFFRSIQHDLVWDPPLVLGRCRCLLARVGTASLLGLCQPGAICWLLDSALPQQLVTIASATDHRTIHVAEANFPNYRKSTLELVAAAVLVVGSMLRSGSQHKNINSKERFNPSFSTVHSTKKWRRERRYSPLMSMQIRADPKAIDGVYCVRMMVLVLSLWHFVECPQGFFLDSWGIHSLGLAFCFHVGGIVIPLEVRSSWSSALLDSFEQNVCWSLCGVAIDLRSPLLSFSFYRRRYHYSCHHYHIPFS